MNWLLLLPSTWNLYAAILNLFHENFQIASQGLSDVFILITIGIALFFGIWAAVLTAKSLMHISKYLRALMESSDFQNAISKSNLILLTEYKKHLLLLSHRDGSNREFLYRTVDAAEIFRDSELAPKFKSSRLFLSIPSILTGIGVLGTFVGLQIGIGGLDLKDIQNLEKSIIPLIQGCAVAFSTSVWGVTCSLSFSGAEKILEGIAQNRVRKVQRILNGAFPRYIIEEAFSEIQSSSRGSEEILKGLAVAIGDQMQMAIGRLGKEIKDSVSKATIEGQQPLMEKTTELLTTAITTEIVRLKEQIGEMSSKFSAEFTGVSDDLNKSVQSFKPTMDKLSSAVVISHKVVTNAIEKLNAHENAISEIGKAAVEIRSAAEAFGEMRDTLQLSSENNKKAADSQLTASNANSIVAEKFDRVGERLPEIHETIQAAAQVIASISGPITDLKYFLEKLPDNQKEYEAVRSRSEEERSTRLLTMSANLSEKVGAAATEFSKIGDISSRLSDAAVTLDAASKSFSVFSDQLHNASLEQRKASESARSAALSNERTAAAIERLPTELNKMSTSLVNASNKLESGAEKAKSSYQESLNLAKEIYSATEIGLRSLKDRLNQIIKAYGEQIEGQTKHLMLEWTQQVTQCIQTYQNQVEKLDDGLEELQDTISKMKLN